MKKTFVSLMLVVIGITIGITSVFGASGQPNTAYGDFIRFTGALGVLLGFFSASAGFYISK